MTGASGRLRPDPRRKARFREIARGIVAKDRYNRKYGIAVDTAGAIAQALEHATAATPEPTAQGLRLACPREQKMAVLAALAPFGARVLDIKMHEPSLEDVFFGFSD